MIKAKTKITSFDIIVALCLLTAGIFLAYRVWVGLEYKWEWKAIPQYLFRYDAEKGEWVTNLLIQGLYTTIKLSVWGTVLATIIGTVMGLCRVSGILFNRLIGRTYVELIRNPSARLGLYFLLFREWSGHDLFGGGCLYGILFRRHPVRLGPSFCTPFYIFGIRIGTDNAWNF